MTALSVVRRHDGPARIRVPSYVPTRVVFGTGALDELGPVVDELAGALGARRILLLTGRRSAAKSWQETAARALSDRPVLWLENPVPNPTIASTGALIEHARTEGVDLVVAVGGGSVIDAGKAVAAMVNDPRGLGEILAARASDLSALPLVAVPTTSGTGSEVTASATIWDDAAKVKHSLFAPTLFPRVAVVDPALTLSLPPALAAGTGLDALAHGMESCWSTKADAESIEYGISAVSLVMDGLLASIRSPADTALRRHMALASLYAGFSIAKGQTTIAHAISYPLTVRYGIHHGHACGASLGALLAYNAAVRDDDCQDKRGAGHVTAVLDRLLEAMKVADGAEGARRLHRLIAGIGLPTFDRLPGLDLGVIARDVVAYDRFGNNPRQMDEAALCGLLEHLRGGRPEAVAADGASRSRV